METSEAHGLLRNARGYAGRPHSAGTGGLDNGDQSRRRQAAGA